VEKSISWAHEKQMKGIGTHNERGKLNAHWWKGNAAMNLACLASDCVEHVDFIATTTSTDEAEELHEGGNS
jgi:hypothetical protein